MSKKTILAALQAIGAKVEDVLNCETIEVEFSRIKKVYMKRVLVTHPDKGGDPAVFREVQEAWESLRDLFEKNKVNPSGFPFYFSGQGSKQEAEEIPADFFSGPRPSYEFYEAAAQEDVPTYRVESAKSSRSQCKSAMGKLGTRHTDPFIEKGEVRFGSWDSEGGSYGRWHHLNCWRIPSRIWLGLPPAPSTDAAQFEKAIKGMNHVILSGFSDLSTEEKAAVVAYFMDPENYAKKTKKSAPAVPYGSDDGFGTSSSYPYASGGAGGFSSSSSSSYPAYASASSQALTAPSSASTTFVVPRPGLNGAQAGAFNGKTFVLTGVFPEVGGGGGLTLGKDRVEAMITAFGGRVTGSVSGKTNYLVVGKEPGAVKVNAARQKEIPLLDIAGLKAVLETPGASIADAPAAVITTFSTGYYGNGKGAMLGNSYVPEVRGYGFGAEAGALAQRLPSAAPPPYTRPAPAPAAPSFKPVPAPAPAAPSFKPVPAPAPAAPAPSAPTVDKSKGKVEKKNKAMPQAPAMAAPKKARAGKRAASSAEDEGEDVGGPAPKKARKALVAAPKAVAAKSKSIKPPKASQMAVTTVTVTVGATGRARKGVSRMDL